MVDSVSQRTVRTPRQTLELSRKSQSSCLETSGLVIERQICPTERHPIDLPDGIYFLSKVGASVSTQVTKLRQILFTVY